MRKLKLSAAWVFFGGAVMVGVGAEAFVIFDEMVILLFKIRVSQVASLGVSTIKLLFVV